MATRTVDGRTDVGARQSWMRVLAAASTEAIGAAWQAWEPKPLVQDVRGPEAGLVMVRARADTGGARFNVGEATVARATVHLSGGPLDDDALGTSYLLGTDLEHARLAAVFDGMLQDPRTRARVLDEVIAPLDAVREAADAQRRDEARSTVVDFFTVSREHA